MAPEIEILLNGEKRGVPAGCTVEDLIRYLELDVGSVAVEVNRSILKRAVWKEHVVEAGDAVEIVHFVGGGNDR